MIVWEKYLKYMASGIPGCKSREIWVSRGRKPGYQHRRIWVLIHWCVGSKRNAPQRAHYQSCIYVNRYVNG